MRQTIGSPSSLLFQFFAALLLLASLTSAFYVPYAEDYFLINNPVMEKRTIGSYGGSRDVMIVVNCPRSSDRHEKREFSADDLSLRFGKRSGGGHMAFNPEDLHLRFGRK